MCLHIASKFGDESAQKSSISPIKASFEISLLIFLPFLVQAVCIFFDEYVYHLKRGLPRWERIGHPLDTFSVLACFLFVLFIPYSPAGIKYYVGVALMSCVLITKDEFVHKHVCPASEQWLHALLFVNHSILLSVLGVLWPSLTGEPLFTWLPNSSMIWVFLWSQTLLTALFLFYQIVYWNFIYDEQDQQQLL